MVNTNIQGVIPLNGRGATSKIKGNYQPGEYKKLSNFRIHEGILQTRDNITHYLGDGAVAAPVTSAFPIIGFMGEEVIVASATEHFSYKVGTKAALWAPTSLPTDGNASSFHKIVGAFQYNNLNYWLTWRFDFTTSTHTLRLYWASASTALTAVTFASLTSTTLFTSTEVGFVFNNFFVFKERLWITTSKGVYCSKSTDPGIFAAPDGFLVKFPGRNVNYAFGHKDSVFILADSAIYNFSYGANPNTDGYMREVSNVMGADHGVSHGDSAFCINTDGLFSISPNSIEVVRSDFGVGYMPPLSKLVSYDNYLIVLKYNKHAVSALHEVRIRRAIGFGLGTPDDPHCWFIDMQTGATHTLDFNDQFTGTGLLTNERGYVTDLIVNPNKNTARESFLTIMTTKVLNEGFGNPTYSQFYRMDNGNNSFFIFDLVVNDPADNIVRKMKPNIQFEIDSYAPDGNEYGIKKFRNLELMGNFSFWDFEILFAYDNQDYSDAKARDLISDLTGIEAAGTKRAPYPARVGLNQRARCVSIILRTKNPRVSMATSGQTIYERVQITDMRVLWTYTGRGPTHLTQSPST